MTPTFNRRPGGSRPFQATHRPRGSRKLVRFDAPSLPADLAGTDWIQVADADQRYSAVDLIELAVKAGTVVTIAHDERVTVPEWLAQQFQPENRTMTVNGRPMRLLQRHIDQDTSLTFGSNNDATPRAANMCVVFVNGR